MAKLLFDANGVFVKRLEEFSESIPVRKPAFVTPKGKQRDDAMDTQLYGLKASQIVLDDPLKGGKEDA